MGKWILQMRLQDFFPPEGKKRFMTETTAGAEKVLPVHGGRIDFAA